MYVHSVTQSRLTLCDAMDCCVPGSIHGIFQARKLKWVAIYYPRGSSQLRDQTHISCISCIDKWIDTYISIERKKLKNHQSISHSIIEPSTQKYEELGKPCQG